MNGVLRDSNPESERFNTTLPLSGINPQIDHLLPCSHMRFFFFMISVTYLYTVNPKGTTLVELHILIMLYCFHLAPVFVPCETSSGETLLLCTNIR